MVQVLWWLGGRESSLCFGKEFHVTPVAWRGVFAALLPAVRDGYHLPTSGTCTGLMNVLCITKYRCCSYAG